MNTAQRDSWSLMAFFGQKVVSLSVTDLSQVKHGRGHQILRLWADKKYNCLGSLVHIIIIDISLNGKNTELS